MEELSQIEKIQFKNRRYSAQVDVVPTEAPLDIKIKYWNQQTCRFNVFYLCTVYRTPGNDHELAIGFLLSEKIIKNVDSIGKISIPREGEIIISFIKSYIIDDKHLKSRLPSYSSCGMCGQNKVVNSSNLRNSFVLKRQAFKQVHTSINSNESLFKKTGGSHWCALFKNDGSLVSIKSDVGRHNAMDKLLGEQALEENLPLKNQFLCLSGRISFELVHKCAELGISHLLAFGSPSSMAIETARTLGITLIGFFKEDSFNIYSHHEQLDLTVEKNEIYN